MTRSRLAPAGPSVLVVATLAAACATSAPPPGDARECAGFVPPAQVAPGSVPFPPSFAAANVGGEVTDEIVVGRDGSVRQVRFVPANNALFAPFAEEILRRSRFTPASIEGNPVAARVQIVTVIGKPRKTKDDPLFDDLRAFVPGGQSREARWQLAGSVDRLTVVARLGSPAPRGATVAAVGPKGGEKTLLTVGASAAPRKVRETVKTGKLLADAGDYRIELRVDGKVVATTTVTIAARHEDAIVNACEPVLAP